METTEKVKEEQLDKNEEIRDEVPQDVKDQFLKQGASKELIDSKIFGQLYGKSKRLEREVEGLGKANLSSEKVLKEFKEHNQKLMNAFKTSIKEVASTKDEKDEKAVVSEKLREVETRISSLIDEKAKALKEFDYKAVAQLDEDLADLRDSKKELKSWKPKEKQATEEDETLDAFESFQEDAPWFKEDRIMKAAAVELDKLLVKDRKWKNASDAARLEEVRNQIEKRFHYKPEKTKEELEEQNGPPSGDFSKQRGPKIKDDLALTDEEKQAARKFHMTEADYLEQKKILAKEAAARAKRGY